MTPNRPSTPPPDSPADLDTRTAALVESFEERILVLDGATGTGLQAANLTADDFGGPDLEGCNEILVETRPDVILDLHRSYLEAGADIVETNTFGGTPLVLAEYGLADRAFELNRRAALLARQACAEASTPERLRLVCGSMGPTTKAVSVTGGVTFAELAGHFRAQALGLLAGGADYLLLETCQDTRNIKAGLVGIERAFEACGWKVPVAVSVTIEVNGTMLAGQDAEALAVSLQHVPLLYVGLNCATGPEHMADHLRTLSELAHTRVACVPNAGLPDEHGDYTETADDFTRVFDRFLDEHWVNLVGGCCGTTPAHIRALAELVAAYHSNGRHPRPVSHQQRSYVSGIEAVELTPDNRPLLVGERTNVLGSRKFRRLVQAADWEAAAEVGRAQVRGGAQVVDVCLQDPDREESDDMEAFLDRLVRVVKAPLMIDTTDPDVMERALTWCQGKSVLNSINLEDGRARFDRVVPLARRYGAALVVGAIDEQGMAVTAQRKIEVVRRSYEILTEEMGLAPEDLWFDALVFPCGTGDETYVGSAAATVDGVRRIHEELPLSRTILGISNVSFGLPPAGREVLNAVFLYHATKAGLDAAIVNTEGLARYAEIPEVERKLAEALIFLAPGDTRGAEQAVANFTEHFRGRSAATPKTPRATLPLDQRIARAVVEGSKEGLLDDLEAALADPRWPEPLDIINGPLMTGMAEVGRLFNDNQLIVAEVLQSAEVMKAAVNHLEPHMEHQEGANRSRGKLLLATVKGDVHDIGKNLVDIVVGNNGFEVVNLGTKVASETLIRAAQEHDPDVIGLSGLLVKSAQQMVLTAEDLRAADITTPLLVGGAALSRRFTHNKIAPAYGAFCTWAKDAMHGLSLVERLTDPEQAVVLTREVEQLQQADATPLRVIEEEEAGTTRSSLVRTDLVVPQPPDLERHVATLDLDEVWAELNPQMLYGKHLGLRGNVERLRKQGDEKLAGLERLVEELKEAGRAGGMTARAVWQWLPAESEGNTVRLFDPESGRSRVVVEWTFPRQRGKDGLCIADYVLENDHLCLFVTTAGREYRERVEQWKAEGEYLRSHAFAALALETAEAAAEWLHARIREQWGIGDPPGMTKRDRFAARYQGKRYSFGYPACPDLGGQRGLFEVLRPEEVGVELTEGEMMEPEASVSGLVVWHPGARYFGT